LPGRLKIDHQSSPTAPKEIAANIMP
jgi:hypothetical protein